MKIISLFFTVSFLIATTSVAQIRYAFDHPNELLFVVLNFAMAICIYMLTANITSKKYINIIRNLRFKIPNIGYFRRTRQQKAYRIR